MTATASPRLATVLAALRDAGFPGAVARRQFRTVRKAFRTREQVEHLDPAIPVGTFTWQATDGTERQLLTGVTPSGDYVTMGGADPGDVTLTEIDPIKASDALRAHARLHGVRLTD